jgi:polyhydroxyalkanoate synthesis regulator phasin
VAEFTLVKEYQRDIIEELVEQAKESRREREMYDQEQMEMMSKPKRKAPMDRSV